MRYEVMFTFPFTLSLLLVYPQAIAGVDEECEKSVKCAASPRPTAARGSTAMRYVLSAMCRPSPMCRPKLAPPLNKRLSI